MCNKANSATVHPDPASVFACALSLWQAWIKNAQEEKVNLSDCYNGMDQFMREVMRVANLFESWACIHIEFNDLDGVWPYVLEDRFGEACLAILLPSTLAQFDDSDCLRVAIALGFPVIFDDECPIPIDIRTPNPVFGSLFRELRIQTVRDSIEDGDPIAYWPGDEPFDEEFGTPYFALYGVADDGLVEHIADRTTYSEVLSLAQKLAPGVAFPSAAIYSARPRPQ